MLVLIFHYQILYLDLLSWLTNDADPDAGLYKFSYFGHGIGCDARNFFQCQIIL